jgi:hypothetical protein
VARADVCTDPACFKLKRDAHWKRRENYAKASGQQVLNKAETDKVFPKGYDGERGTYIASASGYIDLDERCDADPKHRTWRQLTKKTAPPAALARDGAGKARELVKRADAQQALKAAGHDFARTKRELYPGDDHQREYQNRQKREQAIERELKRRVTARAVAAVEARGEMSLDDWRAIARSVVSTSWSDTCKAIVQRRSINRESGMKVDTVRALNSWIAGASEPELRALLVELALERTSTWDLYTDDSERLEADLESEPELGEELEPEDSLDFDHPTWGLLDAAALFGVDAKAVHAETIRDVDAYLDVALNKKRTREIKRRAKDGAEPKNKRKGKAKPKDQKTRAAGERDDQEPELEHDQVEASAPACRVCGCTEMNACPGGCYWIEPDLCSACEGEVS